MSTVTPAMAAPAGFFRRVAAGCYDLLLVTAILVLSSFAVVIARGGKPVDRGNIVFQLFIGFQVAAFFIGFWSRGGQTLGMRAWHIRVETESGEPPSTAVAARRFAAAVLSAAVLGLGFFWILVDRSGRAWHDRLSGTRVVFVPAKNV